MFFNELGARSSGCETAAVLQGVWTRIQRDQFWTLNLKKNSSDFYLPVEATLGVVDVQFMGGLCCPFCVSQTSFISSFVKLFSRKISH